MADETPKTTEDIIRNALEDPASASFDGNSVSQHNLKDMIETDRYLASKKASRGRKVGVRLFKFQRGGFND